VTSADEWQRRALAAVSHRFAGEMEASQHVQLACLVGREAAIEMCRAAEIDPSEIVDVDARANLVITYALRATAPAQGGATAADAPATPTTAAETGAPPIDWRNLVRHALRSSWQTGHCGPLWVLASDLLGLGSARGKQVCRDLGYDPDAIVAGPAFAPLPADEVAP